ncbi:hypothetical protein WMF01_12080 [Sorangium sp. So ce1667]
MGSATTATRSILVQAPIANTAAVYVGGTGVTTLTGIELLPGDAVTIPTASAASIFAVSGTAGQKLRLLVV